MATFTLIVAALVVVLLVALVVAMIAGALNGDLFCVVWVCCGSMDVVLKLAAELVVLILKGISES
jgi:hypothetical protein